MGGTNIDWFTTVTNVLVDGLVHQLPNPVAVLFEAVKSVLNGLIDGLLDIPADFFDLVHAARRLKQAFLVI